MCARARPPDNNSTRVTTRVAVGKSERASETEQKSKLCRKKDYTPIDTVAELLLLVLLLWCNLHSDCWRGINKPYYQHTHTGTHPQSRTIAHLHQSRAEYLGRTHARANEQQKERSGPFPAGWEKMSSKNIPADKINLRLILVSGKTKEFLFSPSDSAGDIALTVFENWPDDWESEAVAKAEILRLIYQGRFLHCNVTLGALGLPLGKTTVMHLVPRDNLPEPNSQDQRQKSKGGSSRCCSTSCCIL